MQVSERARDEVEAEEFDDHAKCWQYTLFIMIVVFWARTLFQLVYLGFPVAVQVAATSNPDFSDGAAVVVQKFAAYQAILICFVSFKLRRTPRIHIILVALGSVVAAVLVILLMCQFAIVQAKRTPSCVFTYLFQQVDKVMKLSDFVKEQAENVAGKEAVTTVITLSNAFRFWNFLRHQGEELPAQNATPQMSATEVAYQLITRAMPQRHHWLVNIFMMPLVSFPLFKLGGFLLLFSASNKIVNRRSKKVVKKADVDKPFERLWPYVLGAYLFWYVYLTGCTSFGCLQQEYRDVSRAVIQWLQSDADSPQQFVVDMWNILWVQRNVFWAMPMTRQLDVSRGFLCFVLLQWFVYAYTSIIVSWLEVPYLLCVEAWRTCGAWYYDCTQWVALSPSHKRKENRLIQ